MASAAHDRILVAGTFDVLHTGHFALLHTAFLNGDHVEVWVTDDAAAAVKSQRIHQPIQPFTVRSAHLHEWCDAQTPLSIRTFRAEHGLPVSPKYDGDDSASDVTHPYRDRYAIFPLPDAFGPSVTGEGYTCIVCSDETRAGCDAINAIRREKGMRELEVIVAPLIIGEGGEKLSSTTLRARIRSGGE